MASLCLSNLDEIQEECKLSPIVAYHYATNQERTILNANFAFLKGLPSWNVLTRAACILSAQNVLGLVKGNNFLLE